MKAKQLRKDLATLSHSLTVPNKLRKQGNKFMQKIFLLLQRRSRYKVDRCRLSGGIGKKTSVSVKFDYDCVIYVNNVDPPFKDLLDEWENIITSHFEKLKDKPKQTPYSIQFEIDGFEFDILPARNYAGSNQNMMLQAEIIWEKISKKESASDKAKISRYYSGGLSELALRFIKKQSSFTHDLCRLGKFWNCTILFGQYVSGRSAIIEYLAVKAGQEEEQAAVNKKRSMLRAFRRFLECLTKEQHICTVFFDFYDESRVSTVEKPYLIDPSNPYNNLLAKTPDPFLSTLANCAKETLKRLDQCEKNIDNATEKLFDPQPDLLDLFEPRPDVNTIDIMIDARQNCKEESSRLIVRREKFDSRVLNNMKTSMACVLACLSNMYNKKTEKKDEEEEEKIMKKMIEATKRFVDRSFYKKDHQWISMTQNHEDCDVTFILPIKTKKDYAVYISMTQ